MGYEINDILLSIWFFCFMVLIIRARVRKHISAPGRSSITLHLLTRNFFSAQSEFRLSRYWVNGLEDRIAAIMPQLPSPSLNNVIQHACINSPYRLVGAEPTSYAGARVRFAGRQGIRYSSWSYECGLLLGTYNLISINGCLL